MSVIQIALATDADAFRPTLVAMLSVIENTSRPVTVHFLGHNLTMSARNELEDACKLHPQTELIFYELTDAMFCGAVQKAHYISLVTLGRMYIPKLIQGRVLYLDGDTITCGDVSPFFDLDLKGALIAAVPDVLVLNMLTERRWRKKYSDRIQYFEKLMVPAATHHYFNAGVILFDCDRIRGSGDLADQMVNMTAASKYELLDQDYLNFIFREKVLFVDPGWNCFWGRINRARRLMKNFSYPKVAMKLNDVRIIHFPGARKPWQKLSFSTFIKRFLVVRKYRRRFREILESLR